MPTSLETWQAAMQPPAVVAFFDGMFDRAGVRGTDAGEAFTFRHTGKRIEFADRIDEASVDFTVEIDSAQVDPHARGRAAARSRPARNTASWRRSQVRRRRRR